MESTQEQAQERARESRHGDFQVRFPQVDEDSVPQDEEYCLVQVDGTQRRIRFHDYHEIYAIPGLYERIFYEKLDCQSPALLGMLLAHEVRRAGLGMEALSVLDVGAGNGIMGEVLAQAGARALVGVDILAEAAQAAERDRPGLYDAYHAVNLLDLPQPVERALAAEPFNALTLVAALGFGDIPPEAFSVAWHFVEEGGFVAFNLRDLFLDRDDASGFARLVQALLEQGCLEERVRVRYVHRRSITGEPLYYTGIIGRKRGNLPGPRNRERRAN